MWALLPTTTMAFSFFLLVLARTSLLQRVLSNIRGSPRHVASFFKENYALVGLGECYQQLSSPPFHTDTSSLFCMITVTKISVMYTLVGIVSSTTWDATSFFYL